MRALPFSEQDSMQRTLNEHIVQLRQRIQVLGNQLTMPSISGVERKRVESEIRVAELALTCYLKALEIEQKIA
jgi:hypothetical protein